MVFIGRFPQPSFNAHYLVLHPIRCWMPQGGIQFQSSLGVHESMATASYSHITIHCRVIGGLQSYRSLYWHCRLGVKAKLLIPWEAVCQGVCERGRERRGEREGGENKEGGEKEGGKEKGTARKWSTVFLKKNNKRKRELFTISSIFKLFLKSFKKHFFKKKDKKREESVSIQ